MRHSALLLFIPLLLSCNPLRKFKQSTRTETIVHAIDRIDTLIIIPPRFDSIRVQLPDLHKGVLVGGNTVRWDTITSQLSVKTQPITVPIYIDRETIRVVREQSKTAEKERKGMAWWVVGLFWLALFLFGFILYRKINNALFGN